MLWLLPFLVVTRHPVVALMFVRILYCLSLVLVDRNASDQVYYGIASIEYGLFLARYLISACKKIEPRRHDNARSVNHTDLVAWLRYLVDEAPARVILFRRCDGKIRRSRIPRVWLKARADQDIRRCVILHKYQFR